MQRCELLDYGKVKRPLKLRRDRYPCSCRRPCNGPTPRRVPWVLILSLWACVSSFNVPYVISVGTSKGFFFWSIAAHSVWRDDLANRVTLTHPTVVFGIAQKIIPKTEFSLCSDKASQKLPKMDNSRWCRKLLRALVWRASGSLILCKPYWLQCSQDHSWRRVVLRWNYGKFTHPWRSLR